MRSNPYQSLVSLLSNILEAYTTAFFIIDRKTRHLEMVASQTLSKFLPEAVSLPMEQSGILAQVHKVGHTIHVDKLPEVYTALASTLPFYREGESHIKGLFVVPVGDGAGVLYVDTKYGWGFNDKQQKWIREIADVLHELLLQNEFLSQKQDCAHILDCWKRIDEVSFKGLGVEEFTDRVIAECTQLLGADLGFIALKEAGDSNYRLLAATAGAPRNLLSQYFLVKQGLVGRALQNMKPFFIARLNPQTSDHFLFASSESLPHHGSLWVLPAQLSVGHTVAMVFLTRQPTEWSAEYQGAVTNLFHIVHLLLEQLYLQEECRHLQTFDFTTGFVNALVFESRMERLLSTSMQNSTPFILALVQFEPWQILHTKAAPGQIRQWQEQLASALRQSLPPEVLVGQITENRFGLLFSGLTEQDANSCLALLKDLAQRVFGGRLKKVRLLSYLSTVGFPQDGTRSDELWTLANQRLFAAFRSKNETTGR